MQPEPDLELVRRAQRGDEAAFEALVRRHRDRVYSVALGVVRHPDDAADVGQETFIAVLRHLRTYQEGAAFTTWLHRITVRKAYDLLRRRVPQPVDPAGVAVGSLAASDPDPQSTGLARGDVLDAIGELEPAFRDAVLLVDVAGIGVEEAAAALGVAPGTIKSRVFRGRAAVARRLGTLGYRGASE